MTFVVVATLVTADGLRAVYMRHEPTGGLRTWAFDAKDAQTFPTFEEAWRVADAERAVVMNHDAAEHLAHDLGARP